MVLAVLTISDRCSRGEMNDTAGPAVVALLRQQWPDAEIATGLLPDQEDAIAAELERLCEGGAALVLTWPEAPVWVRAIASPEATRQVIEREAPGGAEAMRAQGALSNKFAWLSRAVAGLKGSTLIVNLPGSKTRCGGKLVDDPAIAQAWD